MLWLLYLFLDQDPRDYFDFQQANAVKTLDDSQTGMEQMKCSLGSEEAYDSLRASISKIKTTGLRDPLFSPDVALKVIYLYHIILHLKNIYLFFFTIDKCIWLNARYFSMTMFLL